MGEATARERLRAVGGRLEHFFVPDSGTYVSAMDPKTARLRYLRMVGVVGTASVVLFAPSLLMIGVPADRHLLFLAAAVGAVIVVSACLLGPRRDSRAAMAGAAVNALVIAGLGYLLGGYYHQVGMLYALVVVGHTSIHGLKAGLVMVLCGTILVPLAITAPGGLNVSDPVFAFLYLMGMTGVILSRDRLRERDTAAILASETKYRELVERVPAVVYTAELGSEGAFPYVSPRAESWLGYPVSDWAVPGFWIGRIHPDDRERVIADEDETSRLELGRETVVEYRMIDRNGRARWVRDRGMVVDPADGSPPRWSGFLVDITERKALEEQLEHQAFHDPLTGLANRALFTNRVEHAITRVARNAEAMAVLFLDLDEFKTVNDAIGHDAGDELLVAVGHAVEGCLRPMDTVARLGGDEFAILLEDLPDADEAARIADRVLQAIARPFVIHGHAVEIGASIGIVAPIRGGAHVREILRNADSAMYAAKRLGKGRHESYAPAMHEAAARHLELTGEIRQGLDHDEFVVHYQPCIRLADGSISGFEALVRWRHPRLGLVPPGVFIPTAEETGQIVPIGRFVIDRACRQARAWQDALPGAGLGISVNVSARQFRDESLVPSVVEALAATSLDPAALILEITESVVMDDSEAALERLVELKALGVRLAIDDFGTGYSSLSYLRRLPVDVLKIDKSFVDSVAGDQQGRELARVIVRMARTLRLETIAEGVEKPAQAAALRRMGCDQAQGYHFARPMTPDQASRLLLAGGHMEARAG